MYVQVVEGRVDGGDPVSSGTEVIALIGLDSEDIPRRQYHKACLAVRPTF